MRSADRRVRVCAYTDRRFLGSEKENAVPKARRRCMFVLLPVGFVVVIAAGVTVWRSARLGAAHHA